MNPKDNMQIAAYDDSQFRRRLLEHLDKPYDHEEYKSLLIELCDKKQLERQYETWKGGFESYDTEGVTTPYHVIYPGRSVFSQFSNFSGFLLSYGSIKFGPKYAIKIQWSQFNLHY